ncbi:MAG: ABC transporter substrate-binding protein [Bifidobacteriaceae bacterium]|jgi:iron complex transport system substrate-binding protein|nr:ABC transporter substrate-binding protein [Bifidobacteriaceae bacterium]
MPPTIHHTGSARRAIAAAVAAAALGVSALAGCSDRATQDATGSPTPNQTGAAISFEDQRGVTVTLDGPADKIASAVIPAPAIIAAVDGSWDRIVGINQSLLDANKLGIISKAYPAALTTPVIADSSFEPNMEEIIKLAPDLVVQWGDMGTEVTEPIEQAGIPTVGLRYGTQEDLETWITMFGQIVGKTDRASQIIDLMHEEAANVAAKTAAIGGEKPRALSLSYTDDALSVPNGSDYSQFVFDTAGVTNVSKDSEAQDGIVGPEQIISWDPEIIFLSAFGQATPADVYADPRLADVSAVKNKRVYRSPLGFYRWQVPCAESPLMWNWVASVAYPDDYEVDFRALMTEHEQFMYNYTVTDEDIDLVLRADINNDSSDYAELFGK